MLVSLVSSTTAADDVELEDEGGIVEQLAKLAGGS